MTNLGVLADLVGGRLEGDAAMPIGGASALADVRAGEITLIDSPQRLAELDASGASAVLAPGDVAGISRPAIRVADVHAAFAQIVRHFRPAPVPSFRGVHPAAIVSPTAEIAEGATIHAGAIVGENVQIGRGTVVYGGAHVGDGSAIGCETTIHPNVVLYENTRIGDRVVVHAGAVIGAHGFGYEHRDGRHLPAAQLGWVEIGNDVEIGASTTIDRGTYGPTRIGEGTKIDNLVQIAHNCRIGRHNLICAQVGIAGSTNTGDFVIMAGQVGVRDHVQIGRGAVLSAKAGITADVPEGAVMMGIPATPEREQKLKQAALAKLPEMRKEFKAMLRTLATLEGKAATGAPRAEGEAA